MSSVLSIWYWYRSGDNVALENEVSEFIEVQFSEVRLVVNGERFGVLMLKKRLLSTLHSGGKKEKRT